MHDVVELSIYHPEREWDGERDLQLEMAWYELRICSVGRTHCKDDGLSLGGVGLAERLWRRPVSDIDEGRIETISHEVVQGEAIHRILKPCWTHQSIKCFYQPIQKILGVFLALR